jgi:hypothetical protein
MASKPRKLLVAALGIGTVTFACCAIFPGCNLVISHCEEDPSPAECRGVNPPDDFAAPEQDLSEKDQ